MRCSKTMSVKWGAGRLKDISVVVRGGSPRPIDDYLSDTGYNWVKISDATRCGKYISSTIQKINQSGLSKTRMVFAGDLILTNSMSFGHPYIMAIDGCIHDGWVAIQKLSKIVKEFLYFYLLSDTCVEQFQLQVDGGVVKNLNVEKIGVTKILLPPLSEQRAIADYLDEKCGKVDERIKLLEKKVEAYKKLKRSVINEAVTRGLDKNAKLKDSGVDWIGMVPEGWEIGRFPRLIKRFSIGINPRDNFKLNDGGDLFYVTIANFKQGKLFLNDACDRIDRKAWSIIQARSDLRKGDVLFASISKEGQAYVISEDPENWNINESVFSFRPDTRIVDTSFFYYQVTCEAYYSRLLIEATGSTFKSIKQEMLKSSSVVIPPLKDQQAIAAYLDEKCGKIDGAIANIEKQIDAYKRLKRSLINEVVTGKRRAA